MKRTLFAAVLAVASAAHAAWTPPPQPDPAQIYQEAQADARAGNYEDALAKQVWFHENALRIQPSLAGVRLSFALNAWIKLGAAYPPALTKLKAMRDEAANNVRAENDPWTAFFDFASINQQLHEDTQTKELFLWLDANKPAVAKQVFELAQPALIQAKEYRLCGAYVEPDASYERISQEYDMSKSVAEAKPDIGPRLQEIAQQRFSNGAATLVAILALSERKADAARIADKALAQWNDPGFRALLEKAKAGEAPATRP